MALKEYTPGTRFPGTIGRTVAASSPAWPRMRRAPEGAPNVVFVVLDDVGFGHLGCYGSPIATPHIDALAAEGLRYTNMHTAALCSSSRACILTGRNHHSNHMGCPSNASTGYPGYDGYIPFENGFLSEILRRAGYNTHCVGKWDLAPEETTSAAGPYDHWPLGRGFERYYGFLGGDAHQYYPDLVRDNSQLEPGTVGHGYHLTVDLVNRSKAYIAGAKQVAPDKPFFLYLAFGAMHAPHHVPSPWADLYAGAFDEGWEAYRHTVFARQKALGIVPQGAALSRHDPDVPAWESLDPDVRRLHARTMEVFAGFLTHTDHYLGELIRFLDQLGELDDTLIMLVSDNGASAEGGPAGTTRADHYAWGWAHAGNTPFRRWKRESYRGGVSVPLIVCWRNGMRARGELRTQYAHIIDMVPTVLDALDIAPPATLAAVPQAPIEGVTLVPTFDDALAPSEHHTQYFEMMGSRALYHDGWRAVCPWPGPSFREAGRDAGAPLTDDVLEELDATGWELYHVAEDVTESHDLADQERDRLISMIAMWYAEAGKYNVFPLDGRGVQRVAEERPRVSPRRDRYVLYPHTQAVPAAVAPVLLDRPFSITAEVDIHDDAEGVLLSAGGNDGGLAFYIQDGALCYVHNYRAREHSYVRSTHPVPGGHHVVAVHFEPTGAPDLAHGRGAPGRVALVVDGTVIGGGDIAVTAPYRLGQGVPLQAGADPGTSVTPEYTPPFAFSGRIERVIVDVRGEPTAGHRGHLRVALARS